MPKEMQIGSYGSGSSPLAFTDGPISKKNIIAPPYQRRDSIMFFLVVVSRP